MDFDNYNDNELTDTEMMPIIPSTASYAEESNYPTLAGGHTMQNGSKSVSNSKLSNEQRAAALEDPHEKDILELLQQMDEFEPIVKT